MNIRSTLLLSLTALAFLAGCDHTGSTTPLAAEPDIVTVKLAQAADKASQALDSIAGIEQQRHPNTQPIEDYTNAPANLMQPVTIRWSGPIDQIARNLAERAGLRFHTKGNVPAVPLTVTVDAYEKPILHVLRDLGLQAGHRADLAVDPASGVVELRYSPSDEAVPNVLSHHADETK